MGKTTRHALCVVQALSHRQQKEARIALKSFVEKTGLSKEDVLLLMKLENRTEFDRLTVLCEDLPEWVFYDLHNLDSDLEEEEERIWYI